MNNLNSGNQRDTRDTYSFIYNAGKNNNGKIKINTEPSLLSLPESREGSDLVFPLSVSVAERTYPVNLWNGEKLQGNIISMDTETSVISDGDNSIPSLALISVCDGKQVWIIRPENIALFLEMHSDVEIVFHNAQFDFSVIQHHLQQTGAVNTIPALWNFVTTGKIHDTMILDMLVKLAQDGRLDKLPNLAEVADRWAGITDINKEDPYRLRYGEIIGKNLHHVDPGFITYAAYDSIATLETYKVLRPAAEELARNNISGIYSDAIAKYGFLTENIQIKAAIALSHIERLGFNFDKQQSEILRNDLMGRIQSSIDKIQAMPNTEDLFKYNTDGSIKRTSKGSPRMNKKELQSCLIAEQAACSSYGLPPIPYTSNGNLSGKESDWLPYASYSAFVKEWLNIRTTAKQLSFCDVPTCNDRVHSRYHLLKVTGRTGCSDPNIQQLPRDGGFRECFTAALGCRLITIDYSFIELVNLAAICNFRFGYSRLGDVIRQGLDPHAHTAAMMTDIAYDEFMSLKKSDPSRYKDLRQKAKALNFGLPGGLSASTLRVYAIETYNVELTQEEAENWRNKLINEIYPELSEYLADSLVYDFCSKLGCDEISFWNVLTYDGLHHKWVPPTVLNIIKGGKFKKNGTPYKSSYLNKIWDGLFYLSYGSEVSKLIKARDTVALSKIFAPSAITPTGRVRANVSYTEARNNPFQGLAADGAKLALFELVKRGYRVVAFIHDEFIIELPDNIDHTKEAAVIEDIICSQMKSVLNTDLPVKAEYSLSKCWSKDAEAVWSEDGKLRGWDHLCY